MGVEIKNWREAKKRELKERIERLANKLVVITDDIVRYGKRSKRFLRGRTGFEKRNGMLRMLYWNSKISLRQTRKKIYKLEAELKAL